MYLFYVPRNLLKEHAKINNVLEAAAVVVVVMVKGCALSNLSTKTKTPETERNTKKKNVDGVSRCLFYSASVQNFQLESFWFYNIIRQQGWPVGGGGWLVRKRNFS